MTAAKTFARDYNSMGSINAVIIDDSESTKKSLAFQLKDMKINPLIPDAAEIYEIKSAIEYIKEREARFVFCDHRLKAHGYASYDGAELVSKLVADEHLPSILITQYLDADASSSIRQYIRHIPSLLERKDVSKQSLLRSIEKCSQEIEGQIPEDRIPYRSLIKIDYIDRSYQDWAIDIFINDWNPEKAIRFPLSVFPLSIQGEIQSGDYIYADCNIEAQRAEDIFLDNIELSRYEKGRNGSV